MITHAGFRIEHGTMYTTHTTTKDLYVIEATRWLDWSGTEGYLPARTPIIYVSEKDGRHYFYVQGHHGWDLHWSWDDPR